jgi:hypothetical protein
LITKGRSIKNTKLQLSKIAKEAPNNIQNEVAAVCTKCHVIFTFVTSEDFLRVYSYRGTGASIGSLTLTTLILLICFHLPQDTAIRALEFGDHALVSPFSTEDSVTM